jgi:hypothetical protein
VVAQFDAAYCRKRAISELKMAASAVSPLAAEAHRQLAAQYQKRADADGPGAQRPIGRT